MTPCAWHINHHGVTFLTHKSFLEWMFCGVLWVPPLYQLTVYSSKTELVKVQHACCGVPNGDHTLQFFRGKKKKRGCWFSPCATSDYLTEKQQGGSRQRKHTSPTIHIRTPKSRRVESDHREGPQSLLPWAHKAALSWWGQCCLDQGGRGRNHWSLKRCLDHQKMPRKDGTQMYLGNNSLPLAIQEWSWLNPSDLLMAGCVSAFH